MTVAEILLAALVGLQLFDRIPPEWVRRVLQELVPGDEA